MSNRIIPTLQEVANDALGESPAVLSMTNLDGVFRYAAEVGIPEVIVSREWMINICLWMVLTVRGYDEDEEITQSEKWKALREGKVDKFLGVKLILDGHTSNNSNEEATQT